MKKRIRLGAARTFAASIAFLMALTGIAGTVLAEPQDIQTNGNPNPQCWNASTFDSDGTVELNWDGVNLQWPTTPASQFVGKVVLNITSDGDKGNRHCPFSFDSDGPFVSADPLNTDVLLPKTALKHGSQNLPKTYAGSNVQVPLGNPGGGIDDPANIMDDEYHLYLWLADINKGAKADTYFTTVTITLENTP